MVQDIELIPKGDYFDWNFTRNNISNVTGNQRLRSAVLHAVFLKPYEMTAEPYAEKGCHVYDYVKAPNTEATYDMITESIIASCKEVDGVSDARVELSGNTRKIDITSLIVIRDDGMEVIII